MDQIKLLQQNSLPENTGITDPGDTFFLYLYLETGDQQ
jgi:hypothetical protein